MAQDYRCPRCHGDRFYTDPIGDGRRHCIPCEDTKNERLRASRKKWDDANRTVYQRAYRQRQKEQQQVKY